MQFKKVGDRVQVIKYDGYDKVKKRAITSILCSFSKDALIAPNEFITELTIPQFLEVQSYIAKASQSSVMADRLLSLKDAASRIEKIADCLASDELPLDGDQAEKIWVGLGKVQKALRKRGYKKPADSQVQKVPDSRQKNLPV